jgi:CheY-like chemotaxis protein
MIHSQNRSSVHSHRRSKNPSGVIAGVPKVTSPYSFYPIRRKRRLWESRTMIAPTEYEKRKSILLVDDKAFLRRILRDYLEQQPNWVVCGEAEDGVDAIVKAQQLRPDLIVLDFSMPVMNGLEAAKHLKSLLPDTPIVMFTTFDSPQIEKAALAAGICSVESKSDQTALLQCIRGVKYPNKRSSAVAEG